MDTKLPDYVSFPLISAVGGTIVFITPLIGPLLFLPLIPLAELYDYFIPGNFGETGVHVEVGFAWITLKTIQAWMFYISFFFNVGLVTGILKHLTRNKTSWFVGSIVCVLSLAIILQLFISKNEYEQELVRLVTPTETIFNCDEYSALELKSDGYISKFEQDGSMVSNSWQGNVDFDSNTFTFRKFGYARNEHTIELVEQYIKDLDSCHNIYGYSISDLYTINPSRDFFQDDN